METRRRSSIAIQTGLIAEYEQRRRMLRTDEESMRKDTCNKIADIIRLHGSSHQLRHAPPPIVKTQPLVYTKEKQSWPLLQNALRMATDLGHRASDLSHRASEAGQARFNSALHIATKAGHKASSIGFRALHSAEDFLNYYISAAQDTYLRGQEEIERVRRITSEEEHWAILNAHEAALCIRDNLIEKGQYEPLSGRNVEAYFYKLLEQCEMRRRCSYPMPAQKNARKIVGLMLNTRHNPHSDLCIPLVKIQQIKKNSLHENPAGFESPAHDDFNADASSYVSLADQGSIPLAPPLPSTFAPTLHKVGLDLEKKELLVARPAM